MNLGRTVEALVGGDTFSQPSRIRTVRAENVMHTARGCASDASAARMKSGLPINRHFSRQLKGELTGKYRLAEGLFLRYAVHT